MLVCQLREMIDNSKEWAKQRGLLQRNEVHGKEGMEDSYRQNVLLWKQKYSVLFGYWLYDSSGPNEIKWYSILKSM